MSAAHHLGARVLLAEDHPLNQEVLEHMLDQIGCEVTVISTGRAALQSLDDERFDLVLTDCHMPALDGFEATSVQRRREAASGQRVPIVALTTDTLDSTRKRCIAAGMDDYLRKPVNKSMLRTVLQRWIAETERSYPGVRDSRLESTATSASRGLNGHSPEVDESSLDLNVVSVLRATGDDFMSSLSASVVATRCHAIELEAGNGRLGAIAGQLGRLEADHVRAIRALSA